MGSSGGEGDERGGEGGATVLMWRRRKGAGDSGSA